VFSTRSLPRCFREDRSGVKLVELESIRRGGGWCKMAASLGVSECSTARGSEELVGELVRGLLRFSPCEPLLLQAGR
jgi:hypothetical protein